HSSRRTNSTMPTRAPSMNVAMYGMLNWSTAAIVGAYRPMTRRKKEPETPGRTKAQMAIDAAMNTSHSGGSVRAADGRDVNQNVATAKTTNTATALPRMPGGFIAPSRSSWNGTMMDAAIMPMNRAFDATG